MTASPLRVMIVDDEAPAREGLRLRLRRESDVLIIGEHGDAVRAVEALRDDPPDVLFLDVEMPGLDGFALLERAAGGPPPVVVFVTAHDEHAVRAFGVRALDYLLKPVEQERLHEALVRAREHLERVRKGEIADQMRSLFGETDASVAMRAPTPAARAGTDRIAVRRDGSIQFVPTDAIDWIDAAGDAVLLHTGKAEHRVRASMGEMLARLDPEQFLRIHRSTIVNVDRVRELQPYFHGEYMVVLRNGTKLKLSRGYRENAERLLGVRLK